MPLWANFGRRLAYTALFAVLASACQAQTALTPAKALDYRRATDMHFSPDGTKLAVVRSAGGQDRLEYPIDTLLYATTGWISSVRISPKGDRIAFLDHGPCAGPIMVAFRR